MNFAISDSGRITGLSNQSGEFTLQVKVESHDSQRDSISFQVSVLQALNVAVISDVTLKLNQALTAIQASASGGRTPYTYSMSGAPPGIAISSSGKITGRPTTTGTSTIKVMVRDADSRRENGDHFF